MSNCVLVASTAVNALGLELVSADLPAGVELVRVDDPRLRVIAEQEQTARFLLPSIRLETLAASMASELTAADARAHMARFEAQLRAEIDFFEQYADKVIVVDLEAAATDPATTDNLLKARFGWSEGIGSFLEKAHIPPALDRLIWMEKKVSLGPSIQNLVWTLEACATPLQGSHAMESATSENYLESRRYQLANEVAQGVTSTQNHLESALTTKEGELAEALMELAKIRQSQEISDLLVAQLQEDAERFTVEHESQTAALKSEIDALKEAPVRDENLERENADLRAELDKARLGQEISDLLVAQLQEELEMVLADELANASGDQASAASTNNADVIHGRNLEQSAPSVTGSPVRQKKTIKQLLIRAFMTPSVRAKVRRIEGSGYFDAEWYLEVYQDVQTSNMDPAHHFLKFGASEFRDPSPKFSTQRYLWQHPELNPARTNPLIHFLDSSK